MWRFGIGLVAWGLLASATAGELYQILGAADLNPLLSPTVISVHNLQITEATALAAGNSASIQFPLPNGTTVAAFRQTAQARSDGDYVWRGQYTTPDAQAGQVTLTRKNGLLYGLLLAPDAVYEILPVAGGQQLRQLDQARFPECGGAVDAPDHAHTAPAATSHSATPQRASTANTLIDVLVLYTPQARDAAGSVALIEATAQAAVDNANTAFSNSNVPAQFNLVHIALADHDDAGNIGTDLTWVANDSTVASLRSSVGADLVGLLVEDGAGSCGIGYVMRNVGPSFASSGFQVTARTCAVGNLTYAHEHGHNLGLEHDPANGPAAGSASYPWSFGHYVNGSFRTVMSYSTQCAQGCTRVAHFSNPSINYNAQPTGIAELRDNARTLREGDSGTGTTAVVAAFLTTPNLFSDGFESGDLSAWSFSTP